MGNKENKKCFVFNVRKQQDAVDVQYQEYVARSRM